MTRPTPLARGLRVLQVHIPGMVPNMRLSQNGRLHIKERARLKGEAQNWFAQELSLRSLTPIHGPVTVLWRVCFGDKRRRDPDNILSALKPLCDVLGPFDERKHPYGMGLIDGDSSDIIVDYRLQVEKGDSPSTALRIVERQSAAAEAAP